MHNGPSKLPSHQCRNASNTPGNGSAVQVQLPKKLGTKHLLVTHLKRPTSHGTPPPARRLPAESSPDPPLGVQKVQQGEHSSTSSPWQLRDEHFRPFRSVLLLLVASATWLQEPRQAQGLGLGAGPAAGYLVRKRHLCTVQKWRGQLPQVQNVPSNWSSQVLPSSAMLAAGALKRTRVQRRCRTSHNQHLAKHLLESFLSSDGEIDLQSSFPSGPSRLLRSRWPFSRLATVLGGHGERAHASMSGGTSSRFCRHQMLAL